MIVLALAAAVAADSYNHGSYGKQTTDWVVRSWQFCLNVRNINLTVSNFTQAPAHYNADWRVKDDYYYVDMGMTEERYGDNTKNRMDTTYVGYDAKPAGWQKIDRVIEAHPVKVSSYAQSGYAAPALAYAAPSYSAPSYGRAGYKKSIY